MLFPVMAYTYSSSSEKDGTLIEITTTVPNPHKKMFSFMNTTLKKIAGALLFIGLTLGTTAVNAQNSIGSAVQQGNGAYVQKSDHSQCIGNALLGVPNLGNCLDMTQEKFLVTPSGNSMSVWKGTVPVAARPAQRLVYNSTWTETLSGVTRTYDTEAVTMPDGSSKLTLKDKPNGNGKNKK